MLHIRKKYDHGGKQVFKDTNAWVAISEILYNILQNPDLSTTYLIIDALDECQTGLPQLLDLIINLSAKTPTVK